MARNGDTDYYIVLYYSVVWIFANILSVDCPIKVHHNTQTHVSEFQRQLRCAATNNEFT